MSVNSINHTKLLSSWEDGTGSESFACLLSPYLILLPLSQNPFLSLGFGITILKGHGSFRLEFNLSVEKSVSPALLPPCPGVPTTGITTNGSIQSVELATVGGAKEG